MTQILFLADIFRFSLRDTVLLVRNRIVGFVRFVLVHIGSFDGVRKVI